MTRRRFDSSRFPIQFNHTLHLGNMKKVALLPESFTGRAADTDRAVMLSLIEWAITHRAYTIHPGTRNIAEDVGKEPATVSRSIRRLQQRVWLSVIYKPGTFDHKAQQISLLWSQKRFLEHVAPSVPKNLILEQKDIWSGNGLSTNAKMVFLVLLKFPGGKRLFELKTLTNLSEKQNRTALTKLIRAGLVSKDGRIYRDISPKDKDKQLTLVTFIRKEWRIDDKEHARQERFSNDRKLRSRTLTSPDVQRIKRDQYRNKT